MRRWLERVRAVVRDRGDAGNAIIEFVFVAVLVLVPLVYFIAAVASVQRSTLAVTEAAREAGRAFATGESTSDAQARAAAAVRLALADQGLPDDADIRYVPLGAECDSSTIAPVLSPGAEFTVCVTRHAFLPGVPSLLSGKGIQTRARYALHIDDFRTVRPS